ncbi:peroxiredoxin-like family protein [Niabella ginsengisoli]|uniref:thioredoxin-dependent peroxiredoxin n=1 Tax=Niabella ginsengisoli TaxID=522298 RepID=A0ABS9SLP6_9BACT|nr:peroxiredoxin-like family protein [Niabella ginsengisoli]MCH5599289.1 AhpC/TSA family protein [Niabella ginsengisoli]
MKFIKIVSVICALLFSGMIMPESVHAQSYGAPEKPQDVSPLLVGETVPDLKLPDASGTQIDLKKEVSKKPAILVFYRGGWCPYCQVQLAGLQKAAKELESLGYQVMAVSTDSPDNLKETIKKRKLTYTLLSDADLSLSKGFGIAFAAPKNYHSFLGASSGGKNIDNLLPVPAIYILNKKGEIKFEHIDPDFKTRMGPDLLIALAKAYALEVK